jgi:hypothetical protein
VKFKINYVHGTMNLVPHEVICSIYSRCYLPYDDTPLTMKLKLKLCTHGIMNLVPHEVILLFAWLQVFTPDVIFLTMILH